MAVIQQRRTDALSRRHARPPPPTHVGAFSPSPSPVEMPHVASNGVVGDIVGPVVDVSLADGFKGEGNAVVIAQLVSAEASAMM